MPLSVEENLKVLDIQETDTFRVGGRKDQRRVLQKGIYSAVDTPEGDSKNQPLASSLEEGWV